ncbi:MAG: protein kinase [Myxococcaceae bacterium]|nr:protein kinase [Myxococcaceae bacterium]
MSSEPLPQPREPSGAREVKLGGYVLERKLATGGMAEVWLAQKRGLEGFFKRVVLKRILPHLAEDPAFVEMFLNEARLAALLSHPNVVQLFELGHERDAYFLVMEYVNGANLRQVLRACESKGVALPPSVVSRLMVDTCEGLQHAHELKSPAGTPLDLVHRDISPENILVSLEGQTKVADFGVARAMARDANTRSRQVVGKGRYMAPEQAKGEAVDRRTDVWAVGIVVHELLTGVTPYEGLSPALLLDRVASGEVDLSLVRERFPNVTQVLERAFATEREARYASARELGAALTQALGAPCTPGELSTFLATVLDPADQERVPVVGGTAPLRGPHRRATQTDGLLTQLTDSVPGHPTEGVAPASAPVPAPARSPGRRGALAIWLFVCASVLAGWWWTNREPAAPKPVPMTAVAPQVVAVALDAGVAEAHAPPEEPPVAPVPVPEPADAPRKPGPARVAALRPSRVSIRVNPWGDVVLDGQALGTTPLKPLDVAPGVHQVVVTNSELKVTRTVRFEVRGGKPRTVEINLSE